MGRVAGWWGAGGVGPMRFWEASVCLGRSVTFHIHRSVGISQVRRVHLPRQYIALPRSWLRLRMESSVSRDLRSHVPQMWGSSGSSSLVYVSVAGLCGGAGGVVGGEEGVGAVYHPGASGCVVVGGGEGVVYVVHEGHVRGGGWLLVVAGGDIARDVVPEVAQGGHPVDACLPFPRLGIGGGGAGWGVGHVGLVVAGAALGVQAPRHGVSDQVSPPADGGYPDSVPCGGRALTVTGGERGAAVSGDVEECIEEGVSDALPQGGCLDKAGRQDVLGGAGGVEA